ncbi:MAG: hypothetical protein CME24_19550 [Gemmatimonadetes bacterium]|nr:hypothetical protein [Gemmatimonadota bacterium]
MVGPGQATSVRMTDPVHGLVRTKAAQSGHSRKRQHMVSKGATAQHHEGWVQRHPFWALMKGPLAVF